MNDSQLMSPPSIRLAGAQGRMVVSRPAPSVVAVELGGRHVGDLADALSREIEPELAAQLPLQLFVDARRNVGVSMMMSHVWGRWFAQHHDHLARVALLTGSGFLRLTGDFVFAFAGLGQKLELFVDPAAFQRVQARAARLGPTPQV